MSITLFTIETQRHELANLIFKECISGFPIAKPLVFADKECVPGVEHIYINDFSKIDTYHNGLFAYCQFLVKDLLQYINTDHVLFVQSDAMIVNPAAWRDEFLEYDYIGAPWPFDPVHPVGNGGFSLRSKRLLQALQDPRIQIIKGPEGIWNYHDWAEDSIICKKFRQILEQEYKIKIAPLEVARQFSFEYGSWEAHPFGVHGLHNIARYADRRIVEQIPFLVTDDIWNPQRAGRFVDNCLRRGWQDIAGNVINTVVNNRPGDIPEFSNWYTQLSADIDRSRMQ